MASTDAEWIPDRSTSGTTDYQWEIVPSIGVDPSATQGGPESSQQILVREVDPVSYRAFSLDQRAVIDQTSSASSPDEATDSRWTKHLKAEVERVGCVLRCIGRPDEATRRYAADVITFMRLCTERLRAFPGKALEQSFSMRLLAGLRESELRLLDQTSNFATWKAICRLTDAGRLPVVPSRFIQHLVPLHSAPLPLPSVDDLEVHCLIRRDFGG